MQTDQERYFQPSLPSISTIFEGISIHEKEQSSTERGRLESEFLRLQPAAPVEPNIDEDLIHHNEITITTNMDRVAKVSSGGTHFITQYTHPVSPYHYQRGLSPQRLPRNLHSRSFSDYTHPYPTLSPPHHSSNRLAPLHTQHTANNTFHRRAISTTTVDLKLQPVSKQPSLGYQGAARSNTSLPSLYASSSTTTTNAHSAPQSPSSVTTHQDYFEDTYHHHQHQQYTDENHSVFEHPPQPPPSSSAYPPVTASTTPSPFKKIEPKPTTNNYQDTSVNLAKKNSSSSTASASALFNLPSKKRKDKDINLNNNNNKYKCPYCMKGFSRPSSVRIHIYSHTGERPFECPHSGCFRKFSVQSNMRRHMKIHNLSMSSNHQPHDANKSSQSNKCHKMKQQELGQQRHNGAGHHYLSKPSVYSQQQQQFIASSIPSP